MRVLVCGDAYIDLVPRGLKKLPEPGGEEMVEDFEIQAGGSAGYVAAALAALGERAALHSVIGTDDWGRLWIRALEAVGVEVLAERTPKAPTGLSLILPSPESRSFVTMLGANLSSRRLPRLETVDHLTLSGVLQAPGLWSHETLADVLWYRGRGATIFVDGNSTSNPFGHEFLRKLLPLTSVLFVNETETCVLSGKPEGVSGAYELARDHPGLAVVLKLGPRGALMITGKRVLEAPGVFIPNVEDDNGAGDIFLAAFTRARRLGQPAEECLVIANELAAAAVATRGYSNRITMLGRYANVALRQPADVWSASHFARVLEDSKSS